MRADFFVLLLFIAFVQDTIFPVAHAVASYAVFARARGEAICNIVRVIRPPDTDIALSRARAYALKKKLRVSPMTDKVVAILGEFRRKTIMHILTFGCLKTRNATL